MKTQKICLRKWINILLLDDDETVVLDDFDSLSGALDSDVRVWGRETTVLARAVAFEHWVDFPVGNVPET